MRPPRRDHYLAPATGPDTHTALDAAIDSLAAARNLDAGDPATAVHLLASLVAEAEGRFADLVSQARDYGCSWAEIGDLLGVTRASAWQRWSQRQPTAPQAHHEHDARPAVTSPPTTRPRPRSRRRQDRH